MAGKLHNRVTRRALGERLERLRRRRMEVDDRLDWVIQAATIVAGAIFTLAVFGALLAGLWLLVTGTPRP